jgi:hypothetical protein
MYKYVLRKYGYKTQVEFGNEQYEEFTLEDLKTPPYALVIKGNKMFSFEFGKVEIFDVITDTDNERIIVCAFTIS